jgi:hypothetical protein
MYSTQPLVDQYWNVHAGFYAICALLVFGEAVVLGLWKDDDIQWYSVVVWSIIFSAICYMVHDNSYQPEKHYTNTKVIGKFVEFRPEGYNEQHGKTRADEHYMYVVYEIEGRYNIIHTNPNMTWPKEAVFYKN